MWNWIDFYSTFIEWIFLVIGAMNIGRDVSIYIVFFSDEKNYFFIKSTYKFLNFATIGYLMQIKSISIIFRWIIFFFPLRNIY